ncbi:MAG: beta-lactamase family protein [Rhodospirillales bacterium]|nr:beta-lactamase family protein [Rhodospirillales bacterium]
MTDLPTTSPETVGMASARLDRIRPWMQGYVDAGKLPWAAAAIIRHGQVVWRDQVGLADVAAGRAITPDAICRIYSMSKPITAVAALQLYEQGLYQLDDPIGAYIPELAEMEVRIAEDENGMKTEPANRPITIRDLFCHTSGFTYGFSCGGQLEQAYDDNNLHFRCGDGTLADVVGRLASIPLDHHPGARWTYGVSTDVLGRLVEVLSGERFDRYLSRHIFEPLGMSDTFFQLPADRLARFVPCYAHTADDGMVLSDGTADSPYVSDVICFSGGVGLLSTMDDYLRFADMLRGGGESNGERLLGRRTVQYMATNHMPDDGDLTTMGQDRFSETSYAGIGFGLGVSVVIDPAACNTMQSVGEFAWGGMASTAFWIDPMEDLAAVFMTQLIPSGCYPIRRAFRVLVNQALID